MHESFEHHYCYHANPLSSYLRKLVLTRCSTLNANNVPCPEACRIEIRSSKLLKRVKTGWYNLQIVLSLYRNQGYQIKLTSS